MTQIYYRDTTGGKVNWDVPTDLVKYAKQAVIDADSVGLDRMTQLDSELPIEVTIHQSHDIQSNFHTLLSDNNIELMNYVDTMA